MTIKKQEFYEGAALHLLARSGMVERIRYRSPFFIVNDRIHVFFKHSTKGRSPWGFTFMPEEQIVLSKESRSVRIVLGLICGSDGVAGVEYSQYLQIAQQRSTALWVACARLHGQQYEISGPDGKLGRKIPPSLWQRILAG